jgi:hypothetical protein
LSLVECTNDDYVIAARDSGLSGICPDELGAFSEPQLVVELDRGDTSDDDPSLTEDRLDIYFNSEEDIWHASRLSVTTDWGAPELVTQLSSDAEETSASVSPDGLTIWLSRSSADGMGGFDIYVSTRISRSSDWSEPLPVPALNSEQDDIARVVTRSATELLLARGAESDYDIYRATSDGVMWSMADALASINSEGHEADPFLAANGLTLYLTADRPGETAEDDLVIACRGIPDGEFETVLQPITELNSDDDDADAWLSPDEGYIMFASDRSGTMKLYEASR